MHSHSSSNSGSAKRCSFCARDSVLADHTNVKSNLPAIVAPLLSAEPTRVAIRGVRCSTS
eukprot:1276300-Rhodomonas_salina.1